MKWEWQFCLSCISPTSHPESTPLLAQGTHVRQPCFETKPLLETTRALAGLTSGLASRMLKAVFRSQSETNPRTSHPLAGLRKSEAWKGRREEEKVWLA